MRGRAYFVLTFNLVPLELFVVSAKVFFRNELLIFSCSVCG